MFELRYSKKLGPPIVSAAVAMIVFTNFALVTIVARRSNAYSDLFNTVWPIALTSAVAVVLVMSFLYRSLVEVVGELERRERDAHHQALHDQLTGLANRSLLEDRLEQALGRLRRDGDKVALLVLDLDRFKQVNDTLGHACGDLLVRQVSDRLKSLLRETDTIARIGGDEFAIVQTAPRTKRAVSQLCSRIIKAIERPFIVAGKEARVGVSIGAIIADSGSADASELLRKADITMYRAKAAGRNCYRLFTNDMDSAVYRHDAVETALREELDRKEGLDLEFQPQLSPDGAVIGVEGLLRWHHPILGQLSPLEVIPIAEECGLIDRLSELTFIRACEAARRWPHLSIALNLSAMQFRRQNLADTLERLAVAQDVRPDQLELEVTESVFLKHEDFCEGTIRDLRARGFRVALDDFGTGYSSLGYLMRFKVDRIKLDRAFMQSLDEGGNAAIIAAAIALGHALHTEVVAEGISNPQQAAVAVAAGCDILQGHFYAPAMRASEMDSYLASLSRAAA